MSVTLRGGLRLTAAAMAAFAAIFGGCHGPSARIAANPTTYVFTVDWSGSTESVRKRLLGAAAAEIEGFPDGTRVVMYCMGSSTEEYFDGVLTGGDTDALVSALADGVRGSDPVKGTDYSKMAKALASFSKNFKGKRFAVRVLTDGGDDRASNGKSKLNYEAAASALCVDRRMTDIAFYGPCPGTREAIRAAFAGAGNRLRILKLGQRLDP